MNPVVKVSRKRKTPGKSTAQTTQEDTRKSSRASSDTTGVCEHVSDRYEKVGRIGQGTYGIVYKALDKQTGNFVALKRCIPHHESSDGFPLTTLRELHALRVCSQHPNVVDLLTVAVSTNGVFLVFEFCSNDIAQILDAYYLKNNASPFNEAQVKTLSRELLSALKFCHDRGILHRDIKPSNLLYQQSTGRLKLADLGLSRTVAEHMTANVVSLWYRAPELLLQQGFRSYTDAIDVWATGCVVAEMLQGFPLLDGKTEFEQIQKLEICLGTPPYPEWKTMFGKTNKISSSVPAHRENLWDQFSFLSKEGLSFLTKLLEYKSEDRWTAERALQSEYFTTLPYPSSKMPSFPPLKHI